MRHQIYADDETTLCAVQVRPYTVHEAEWSIRCSKSSKKTSWSEPRQVHCVVYLHKCVKSL